MILKANIIGALTAHCESEILVWLRCISSDPSFFLFDKEMIGSFTKMPTAEFMKRGASCLDQCHSNTSGTNEKA